MGCEKGQAGPLHLSVPSGVRHGPERRVPVERPGPHGALLKVPPTCGMKTSPVQSLSWTPAPVTKRG